MGRFPRRTTEERKSGKTQSSLFWRAKEGACVCTVIFESTSSCLADKGQSVLCLLWWVSAETEGGSMCCVSMYEERSAGRRRASHTRPRSGRKSGAISWQARKGNFPPPQTAIRRLKPPPAAAAEQFACQNFCAKTVIQLEHALPTSCEAVSQSIPLNDPNRFQNQSLPQSSSSDLHDLKMRSFWLSGSWSKPRLVECIGGWALPQKKCSKSENGNFGFLGSTY